MRSARVVNVDSAPADEVSGADVVVVRAEESDKWGELIKVRAPNAVVVVVGAPDRLCEATLFPRSRIIGVEAEQVDPVVDAIVHDRTTEFESVVRCEGERGIESEFARVPVRIGGRGVVEIVES
ncbi:MAG: hypothetical protein QOJ29_4619 [Thermoleophilaceae bacterium]|jgi:malate/lactate dehydrogenase|nr:hypothetical protein [Thermoleophilaceae bacterium]